MHQERGLLSFVSGDRIPNSGERTLGEEAGDPESAFERLVKRQLGWIQCFD